MDEQTRLMVLRQILNERDELLLARQKTRQSLASLELQDRVLERGLADRSAAARVFGHKVGYPTDPRDYESMEKLQIAMAKLRGGKLWVPGETVPDPEFSIKAATVPAEPRQQGAAPELALGDRPRIRDRVLEQLKTMGSEGAKAAALRSYLEAAHGIKTHEKTVGMTLYRLLREGLVRRDGRTWFFVPPSAETKNPGGSAPGSIEARSNRKEVET
jgi:hypothetical protein